MNILYISNCDPRLTSSGSAQRSHHLWKALQHIGTVYTVYPIGLYGAMACDNENRICSACFVPDGYFRSRLFVAFNVFHPFVWPFRNIQALKQKMPWKNISFDYVVVRYIGGVALTNAWEFGDVYVDIDDLPTESYNSIYRKRILWPLGWVGSMVVSWWQSYILRRCSAAWVANPDQVSLLSQQCTCKVLPNLPLPPHKGYKINGYQLRQLMTVGQMGWRPNYEGVDWFLDNVWPNLYNIFPELTYKICGRDTPEYLRRKWSSIPGVFVLGFVDDVDKIYEESLAVVSPIFQGAGTCIKVPEAVLHGRKTFATPHAVRGMSKTEISDFKIEICHTAKKMTEDLVLWLRKDSTLLEIEQSEIRSAGVKSFSAETFVMAVKDLLVKRGECSYERN